MSEPPPSIPSSRRNYWLVPVLVIGAVLLFNLLLRYYQFESYIGLESLAVKMEERLQLMEAVAEHKWENKGEIEDPVREAQLIARVREDAVKTGLDATPTASFFTAQIETAKLVQRTFHLAWEQTDPRPTFPETVDLGTTIRPQLDRLGEELIESLQEWKPDLAKLNRQKLHDVLIRRGWSQEAARSATQF